VRRGCEGSRENNLKNQQMKEGRHLCKILYEVKAKPRAWPGQTTCFSYLSEYVKGKLEEVDQMTGL
jgi:hypothetical protein